MEKEENVCEKTTRTEEEVVMEKNALEGAAKVDASAVLGKFKDVNALAKAYEALQAEFTRRSQKLRALERSVENFKSVGAETSGAEKLRKNAEVHRAENKRFNEFIADMGAPFLKSQETSRQEQSAETDEVQALEKAEAEARLEVACGDESKESQTECATEKEETASAVEEAGKTEAVEERPRMESALLQEKLVVGHGEDAERKSGAQTRTVAEEIGSARLPSEELFQQANRDEAVRLRIIGEYLASLGKSDAPLTMGGVGALATQPVRAKSIGDAGGMALMYFKKTLHS